MKISEVNKGDPALLVPMHMEAMVCGYKDNSDYSDIRFRYNKLAAQPSGSTLETEPFSLTEKYDSGVYLHWILPEGLTHGIQQKEGESPVYPNVPNCYLLTRISVHTDKAGKEFLKRREWVIESDFLQEPPKRPLEAAKIAAKCSSIVDATDKNKPYRYMGKTKDYDAEGNFTTQNRLFQEPFTAVCAGSPYFTAYYPLCKKVFSFYDDLSDFVEENNPVRLTYIISGWYEEKEDPIFQGKRTVEEIQKEFFFCWDHMEDNEKRHLICHGVISGICWNGVDGIYPSGLPESVLQTVMTLGHSSAEALAAYICSSNGKPEMERVLESLLEGVLKEWEELDGAIKAEQKIYQNFFRAKTAADELTLQGKYTFLTAFIEEKLEEINEIREEIEKEKENIHVIKEKIYLNWSAAADGSLAVSEGITRMRQQKAELEQKKLVVMTLLQNESKGMREFEALIGHEKPELSGRDVPGQNYWEPNDIVILLEGECQSSIYRKLEQYKEDGLLPCRTEKELVPKIYIDVAEPEKTEKNTVEILPVSFLPKAAVPLPYYLEDIVEEAFLMAESCNEFVFGQIAEKSGLQDKKGYIEYLTLEYRKQLKKEGHFEGKLPNGTAIHQWQPSWNPLFLEWEVEYIPDPELFQERYSFQNWELSDNGYSCRHPEIFQNKEKKECYQGRTLLSPHALINLEEQLKGYMGTGCGELIKWLGGARILSQCMDGLNEQMLGRRSGAVAAIWNEVGEEETISEIKLLMEEESVYQQTEKPCYPVRAGCIKIKRIQVVDSFGRVKEHDIDHMIIPERGRLGEDSCEMLLSPQILAPIRVKTSWNRKKTGDGTETVSPIYGFLWANRFDSCLHIYTPDGKFAGSLQLVYSLKNRTDYKVAFRNPPGEVRREEELFEALPSQLQQFVKALYKKVEQNPKILYELLNVIDESIWNTTPSELKRNAQIYAGLGNPVALTGIKLCVEASGAFPSKYQIAEDKSADSPVEKMKFPIRIGESILKGDGTIGFFEMKNKEDDYEQLHLTTDVAIENEYMTGHPYITAGFSEKRELALLVLPMQPIHLVTGFLPIKEMKLPPEQVEAALEKIYMTLYYGPFLTPKERLEMMIPKALEKEWRFLDFEGPEKPVETGEIAMPQMEAQEGGKGEIIREGWLKLMAQRKEGDQRDGQ